MGLDGRQRQFARAIDRRRFEVAAELDEAEGDMWDYSKGNGAHGTGRRTRRGGFVRFPEELQPQDELAPKRGFDWPVVLMFGLVLVVAAGTGYVVTL